MIGIGIGVNYSKVLGPSNTPRTSAFLTATGITDTTIISALNTMDLALISAGLLPSGVGAGKIKVLYPFVGGTASTHKYNFVDPQDTDAAFRLAFFGGWTHNAKGATPNGTNGYADTFYNPSILATTSSFSMGGYVNNNAAGNCFMGCSTALNSATAIYPRAGSGNCYISIANGLLARNLVGITSPNGFNAVSRVSTANILYNTNGVTTSYATATTSYSNQNIYLGAINSGGSVSDYSPFSHAFDFIGIGMTSDELTMMGFVADWYCALMNRDADLNLYDGTLQNSVSMGTTKNPFGLYEITTDATELLISVNPTLYTIFPDYTRFSVIIDDSTKVNIPINSSNYVVNQTKYIQVSLPDGNKNVKIIEGGTTLPTGLGSNPFGTFLSRIKFNRALFTAAKETPSAPATNYTFVGDSISNGANSDNNLGGYNQLFRPTNNVSTFGYGYGSVYDFATDGTVITSTTGKLDSLMIGTTTNKLVFLLGTNDYGLELLDADDFYTQYLALIDSIIALSKVGQEIYLISPLIRASEGANSFGDTLDDYRGKVQDIATLRSLNFIDGESILTLSDLDDGLHPSTAGHIKLYDYLITQL